MGISDGEEHRALLEECRTAPAGVPLQVLVTDGSSESEDYLLPYPCQLIPTRRLGDSRGIPESAVA